MLLLLRSRGGVFSVHDLALVAEECEVALGALVGEVAALTALVAYDLVQGFVRPFFSVLARRMEWI